MTKELGARGNRARRLGRWLGHIHASAGQGNPELHRMRDDLRRRQRNREACCLAGLRSIAIERSAFCFLAEPFVEIDRAAGDGDARRRQLAGELVDDQSVRGGLPRTGSSGALPRLGEIKRVIADHRLRRVAFATPPPEMLAWGT